MRIFDECIYCQHVNMYDLWPDLKECETVEAPTRDTRSLLARWWIELLQKEYWFFEINRVGIIIHYSRVAASSLRQEKPHSNRGKLEKSFSDVFLSKLLFRIII